MPGMLPILKETDPVLIPGLAQVWGVRDDALERDEQIKRLAAAMDDPARVALVWGGLTDEQRAAMQMIYHTLSRSMPAVQFERIWGAIRRMGSDEIARQNPTAKPQGAAEALYYRGLISLRRENADTGMRTVLFIPAPLAPLLPINQTTYDHPDDEPASAPAPALSLDPLDEDELDDVRLADTSIVDDMITLLAFLRIETPAVEGGQLPPEVMERLQPFLLGAQRDRLRFLITLAHAAGLIDVEGGRALPRGSDARRWLQLPRTEQVRGLAVAWRNSAILDMGLVPGLHIDREAGTMHQYDPRAVRAAVLELLGAHVPLGDWWSLSEFIGIIREDSHDFQRPNGDFGSWYIRDDAGDYLSGIESWGQVEGALLEYLITGPLYWLGLADLAEDAARFNVYGRAFMGQGEWPQRREAPDPLDLRPDGVIVLTRKASGLVRFQVARFTTWLAGEPPYHYRLDADGLALAARQGITLDQLRQFLSERMPNGQLPAPVAQFLDQWRHGAKAAVTLEDVVLLRTTSEPVLDEIFNDPDLRRFLGARVGPMAVIVRADQWQALRLALGERGIQMEVRE